MGLLEQLETLSSSGSLAMVQQFAGPESPIGVAVDRLAQFVGDKDTIAKLKGFLEQGKSILQKGKPKNCAGVSTGDCGRDTSHRSYTS